MWISNDMIIPVDELWKNWTFEFYIANTPEAWPMHPLGNNNAGPSSSLIDSGLLQINRIKSQIE